jgi:hypothetical protein
MAEFWAALRKSFDAHDHVADCIQDQAKKHHDRIALSVQRGSLPALTWMDRTP